MEREDRVLVIGIVVRGVLVFLCCEPAHHSRRRGAVAAITSAATSRLRVLAEYPHLGRVTHFQASVTHGT